MRRAVLGSLLLLCLGCDDEDAKDAKTGDAATKAEKEKAEGGDQAKKKAPDDEDEADDEQVADDDEPAANDEGAEPAAAFDRNALCAELFDPADVGRILGVEGVKPRPPAPTERKGAVSCDATFGDKGTTSALVDCTGRGMNVDTWRDSLKTLGERPEGEYRELSMGQGGAYAKTKVATFGFTHQIVYVHDTLPCYVKVNAGMLEDDKVTALTEHVHAKLDEGNYPR